MMESLSGELMPSELHGLYDCIVCMMCAPYVAHYALARAHSINARMVGNASGFNHVG